MAAQAPWWRPGSASGYHVLNYGRLIGELVHHLTGMSLREFVRGSIAKPLGVDFQIGLRDGDVHRVADVLTPALDFDPSTLDGDTVAYKTFTGPSFSAEAANSPSWRAAEPGAANGDGNAASLGDILAPIARSGASGNGRLLKPATIEVIFDEQTNARPPSVT
ncbi:serine hydrolase [Amycolatopsis pithecellobii]|uniref:serine hydrolase n=1 Tax=Amycolatopsis pithecellobii TaxID=664692 RepID=UPI001AA09718|nr:serine hydrolase domain-containing protein [Amycolatopsis pithecellobii]